MRHHDASVLIATAPPRRAVGRSGREAYHQLRPHKLSGDERSAVVGLAESRSLREIAAEFGVSHESTRAILRERDHVASHGLDPDPHPFDPARMTEEKQGELNALFASLPSNANGWRDLSFLDNIEFERAATLVYQGRGLDWEGMP